MNAKESLNTLVLIALILAFGNRASAQAVLRRQQAAALVDSAKTFHSGDKPAGPGPVNVQAGTGNDPRKLSESQKSLMEGSKRAILKTGISEPYFNRHFRLADVFDRPGDRRVVWKFSIKEYEATVNDAIGYYAEGGKRVDVHSVENVLSSTTDIRRTIPRIWALRIMRACLGRFADPAVEYRASGSGKAGLFLTAASIPKSVRVSEEQAKERERKRREKESREAMKENPAGVDVIEEEEENYRPPIFIGSVNLENGKCTKGVAQAGPPKTR